MDPAPDAFDRALGTLIGGSTLDEHEAYALFSSMLDGALGDARVGAVLALLRTHDETEQELSGAACALREHATRVPFERPAGAILIDTCGTGGAPKTFNVSTAAALVLAGVEPPGASGVRRILAAKHGNRSRTGRGSAEVFERLGVDLDATPETLARCLDEAGVCFCYAVHHHRSIRHAMPARRALGLPTIFNALGPLTNPVGADAQLVGVFKDALVLPVARTLVNLGATRGMVVHSDDALDELTISAPSRCAIIREGRIDETRVDPEALGIERVPIDAVRARDAAHGAEVIRSVLADEDTPFRSMTLLNAAGALVGAGVCADFGTGLALARAALRSGRAAHALETLVRLSRG